MNGNEQIATGGALGMRRSLRAGAFAVMTAIVVLVATASVASAALINKAPDRLTPTLGGSSQATYATAYDSVSEAIFLGGTFSAVGGAARDQLASVSARTGDLLSTNIPVTGASIETLQWDPTTRKLYAGGNFTAIDGEPRSGIARFSVNNTGAVSFDTDWGDTLPLTSAVVHTIAIEHPAGGGTNVYIGGDLNDGTRRGIIKLNGETTGAANPTVASFNAGSSNILVKELKLQGGALWAAGDFDRTSSQLVTGQIGGQSRAGVAKLDSSTGAAQAWQLGTSPTQPGTSNTCGTEGTIINDFEFEGTSIFIAGCFATLNGTSSAANFAKAKNLGGGAGDGVVENSFDPGTSGGASGASRGIINDLELSDDNDQQQRKIYLAGSFTNVTDSNGTTPSSQITGVARISLDGGVIDTAWNLAPRKSSSTVSMRDLTLANSAAETDQLAVGGEFDNFLSDPESGKKRYGFATFSRSPVAVTAHTITASPTQQNVTVPNSPGTWEGAPANFTAQWFRCTSSTDTSTCLAIPGALVSTADPYSPSAVSYTAQAADIGKYLQLRVAASGTSQRAISGAEVFSTNARQVDASWVYQVNGKADLQIDQVAAGHTAFCVPPDDIPAGAQTKYAWKIQRVDLQHFTSIEDTLQPDSDPSKYTLTTSDVESGMLLTCDTLSYFGSASSPTWQFESSDFIAFGLDVSKFCPPGSTTPFPACAVPPTKEAEVCPAGQIGVSPYCYLPDNGGTSGNGTECGAGQSRNVSGQCVAIANAAGTVRVLSSGKLKGRKGAYKVRFEISGISHATQITLSGVQKRTIQIRRGKRKRLSKVRLARIRGTFTASKNGVYTATIRADSKFRMLFAAGKTVPIRLDLTSALETKTAKADPVTLSLLPDPKKKS